MSQKIVLVAEGGNFEIESDLNESDWMKCSLVTKERIFLGSENSDYIRKHLLNMLTNEAFETPFMRDDTEVGMVMALSPHCHALYASKYSVAQKLFWQNALKSPIVWLDTLTLLPEQRQVWIDTVNKIA